MMVTYDLGNLSVVLDLSEDSFTDRAVLLHLSSLFQGQRPGLLKKSSRKTNLPNVVDEPG